jgi:hypothetical protein
MAGTINEAEAQRERAKGLAELKRQRDEVAAKLAEKDAQIAQVEDHDFKARLGDLKQSQMSTKQKSEAIARLGAKEYPALNW